MAGMSWVGMNRRLVLAGSVEERMPVEMRDSGGDGRGLAGRDGEAES